MTEDIIRDVWMVIGTDVKETNPYSPKNRIKAGAKGIGRFALDRLGKKVQMYTFPEGKKNGYHWEIDWSSFEKESAVLGDVKANLEEVEKLNLTELLPHFYKEKSEITFPKGGTILHISGLRDEYSEKVLDNLFQNLSLIHISEPTRPY